MALGVASPAGGARAACRVRGRLRAAWGEFAALLAARVGEASHPGPAAAHGQRTLRLAPGGLALADNTASAPSFDGRPKAGPRASQGLLTPLPTRPGGQRTLDFGSASSVPAVPVLRAGSPSGDEEETPGDVRSLFTEFGRLDVDSSEQQPPALEEAHQPKRIQAVGGQTCAACTRPIMRGRCGYGCSDCAVAYYSAVCRGRGFGTHGCGADAGANALAVAAAPGPGSPSRATYRGRHHPGHGRLPQHAGCRHGATRTPDHGVGPSQTPRPHGGGACGTSTAPTSRRSAPR